MAQPSHSPAPPTGSPQAGVWRLAEVVELPLDALRPDPANARTHSAGQRRMLARSIAAFGFTSPVLVDAAGRIVAGHGRVAAARDLGMATVPTLRLDHLTAAQCRALALADNRIAERAGWDRDLLRIELGGLLELDASVDLTLTGFEDAEIDIVLHPAPPTPARHRARAPASGREPDPGATVSRPGDCWALGRHALLCTGAAAPPARPRPAFPGPAFPEDQPAAMLIGAPPGFGPGLRAVLAAAVAASRPGALHYLCLDWPALDALAAAVDGLYAGQVDLCVWDRGAAARDPGPRSPGPRSPGLPSPYRPQHALVAVYRTRGPGLDPNPATALDPGGRPKPRRANLWRHAADPGAADTGAGGWPERLVADAILDATAAGDVVLDPWGGCGATLLAAERTGRRACIAEADPRGADHAVRHWQAATGSIATLALCGSDQGDDPGGAPQGDPGEAFEAVAARRIREAGDAR